MTIGLIIGVLLLIAGIACATLAIKNSGARVLGKRNYNGVKKPVPCGIFSGLTAVIGVLFLLIPFSFHTVEAGEIAVVKHLGNATKVETPGTYFDFWVTENYAIYDSKVQTINIKTGTYSKDAQSMSISMTVQYQIDEANGINIANKYGVLEILSKRVEDVASGTMKSVLSNYSAMTIIETRATISSEVESTVKNAIDSDYYVRINTVVLTNIDFSDAFEKTVENKMIAEQEKLKAEYEKETAIVNAEKELEVAKLQAEARIATANAEAKSQILIAQAEAKSIKTKSVEVARMLGFGITETEVEDGEETAIEYNIDFTGKSEDEIKLISDYLKYVEYLSKWNGELPGVLVTDGSAQVIIPTT